MYNLRDHEESKGAGCSTIQSETEIHPSSIIYFQKQEYFAASTSGVLKQEPIDDQNNSEESELEKMDLSQPQSKAHQMSIEESFKRVTSYSGELSDSSTPFSSPFGLEITVVLSPSFKIPTVDTLKLELDDTYDLMVNIYKTKFGSDEMGHVALTSDVWSEIMSSRSFIGITVHFLEGGVIESRCIVTKELEDRHTSVHISEKLEEACQQFGINKDKITCVVTDDGANMVAAVNHFLGKGRHLQCFAYTLNLVIENVTNQDSVLLVTNKIREILLNILKPVEYVTREVSGEKCATISKIIPLINCLRAQVMAVDETGSELVEVVKEVLLKEIDDHFGRVEECHLVALACFLDPRFKNIHFSDPKAYANNISLLRRAINTDSSISDTNGDSSTPTAYDFWSHHKVLVHGRQTNKRIALAGEREKDEIALYLANPVAPLYVDPIQQWEDMKHIFPSLYRQAQLYLLAPATSVPAERLFSEAGDTLTKTRNRLLGKRMERLLFLSDCTEEDWQL
uniref:HAT C-terminal dimerisation domain-containing protein n=1 Tax=Timema douglasi TaxID=61478 RepID=A0A7R8VJ39_TIMDO|nr:unnamed protein product [Timema douglasi]